MMHSQDVVIVGGGPAGLATAISLARGGIAVTVLERSDYRARRIGEHLPPGAKPLLEALGLQGYASDAHAACPGVRSFWGSSEAHERAYLFHPCGEGLNLARPAFDRALVALAESLGVHVVTGATLVALGRAGRRWELNARGAGRGLHLCCRVVIDASGRGASLARRLGARRIVYDRLLGWVATGAGSSPACRHVLIEALPEGWWYSTGLADDTVVAASFVDAGSAGLSPTRRSAAWQARLAGAPHTAARFDNPDAVVPLGVRVAYTQRLDSIAGPGWLATGDAAMSYDPLSSEGISKGLAWGMRAAAVAADMCRGVHTSSRDYEAAAARAFARYLLTRYRYYAAEGRWPDAPFWRRRRGPPVPLHTRS